MHKCAIQKVSYHEFPRILFTLLLTLQLVEINSSKFIVKMSVRKLW